MNPLTNEATLDGVRMRFTLYETDDHSSFSPKTQAYGICFTPEGKVLVGKADHHPFWLLPGGTIEDETPEECLIREVDEEMSCDVTEFQLLGVQRVEYPDEDKEAHYQLRYACLVNVNELTVDPASGALWTVKHIPIDELNSYLKWGVVGDRLVVLAKEWFTNKI